MNDLTSEQRAFLGAVLLQANVSHADIARLLGIREHTVRRTVDLFFERKIVLGRHVFIDPYALGLTYYAVLLGLPGSTDTARKKFIELLKSAEQVTTVTQIGGDDQVEVGLYVASLEHLRRFFDDLTGAFPGAIEVRSSLIIVEQEYSGLIEPPGKLAHKPVLRFSATAKRRAIDEVDHRILSALCNLPYRSLQEVSRSLKIPASTLAYRVGVLERAGIIVGHYYMIDVTVFRDLPMSLRITSKILSEAQRAQVRAYCRSHPRIAWVSFFHGANSMEVFIRSSSYAESTAVVQEFTSKFSSVVSSSTLIPQLECPKYTLYPFKTYQPFFSDEL